MKSFLIAILSLALVAAAFFTRPGRRELMLHLLDTHGSGKWTAADIDRVAAMSAALKVKDRILWTDVEHDGKVIYTGAFSHFFARGEQSPLNRPLPTTADLARLMGGI